MEAKPVKPADCLSPSFVPSRGCVLALLSNGRNETILLSTGNERGGARVTTNHQHLARDLPQGGLKRAFVVAQAEKHSVWQRLVSDGR